MSDVSPASDASGLPAEAASTGDAPATSAASDAAGSFPAAAAASAAASSEKRQNQRSPASKLRPITSTEPPAPPTGTLVGQERVRSTVSLAQYATEALSLTGLTEASTATTCVSSSASVPRLRLAPWKSYVKPE
jgi:hypothetical protein